MRIKINETITKIIKVQIADITGISFNLALLYLVATFMFCIDMVE